MSQDISGASLFERFLVEAKDVPPSRLKLLAVIHDIHAASPALQGEVIESCVRVFSSGAHPRVVVGKYAELALRELLHPLLCDARISWTLERATRLLAAAQAIPRAGLVQVFQRLAEGGGWTEELRAVVFENDALAGLRAAAFDPLPRPGERWSDGAREDLAGMPGPQRDAWVRLFDFLARRPPSMSLTPAWEEAVAELRAAIGERDLRTRTTKWLAQVAATAHHATTRPSRLLPSAEHNAALLHGFVAMLDDASLSVDETDALAQLVRVAFSVDDFGAYLPSLGYRALNKLRLHREIVLSLARDLPFSRVKTIAQRVG